MLKHGLTKTVPWYYKTGAALEVLGGSSNSQHAMIHMQSTMSKGFFNRSASILRVHSCQSDKSAYQYLGLSTKNFEMFDY